MAVDKFQVFSLGVLTFTTHKQLLCALCYILYIEMPKFGGASALPSTHLSMALTDYMSLHCGVGTSGVATPGPW